MSIPVTVEMPNDLSCASLNFTSFVGVWIHWLTCAKFIYISVAVEISNDHSWRVSILLPVIRAKTAGVRNRD